MAGRLILHAFDLHLVVEEPNDGEDDGHASHEVEREVEGLLIDVERLDDVLKEGKHQTNLYNSHSK